MDSIDLVTLTLTGGGRYCLLALCFTFVWWSSRTFFITAGAFIPLSAATAYLLAGEMGVPLPLAIGLAIILCAGLGIAMAGAIFEPFSRRLTRSTSGPGSALGGVVLNAAIVSFALYLVLVNAIQWFFGGMTDAITLRPEALEEARMLSLPGTGFGIRTNAVGGAELLVSWFCCGVVIWLLSSRFGLRLRAIKSNLRLFDQITGHGFRLRILAFGLCSGVAALAGSVLLLTGRVDVTGGLPIVLGAMVVMILGTQTRRLILLPVFSLAFAFCDAWLQARGLSIWVQPISLSILLAVLLLSPRGLVRDVQRVEEELEA